MLTVLKPVLLSAFLFFVSAIAYLNQPLQEDFRTSIDQFIDIQSRISLQGVLNNIGPNGTNVAGISAGVIVASPSKCNPDYFYTWTRDSSLSMKMLAEDLISFGKTSLQPLLEHCIDVQERLQNINNPSGGPLTGGIGEPKFNADLTAYTGTWGRPQRDGPALRIIALATFADWLIARGSISTVSIRLWPIIKKDIMYIERTWSDLGFDVWEEVKGLSFFTIIVQHQALLKSNLLAARIGESCDECVAQAPKLLSFMQNFWNGRYVLGNIHEKSERTAIDASTLLGSIHAFDRLATCDDITFQPCSARSLANHKAVVDSFRSIYKINSGTPSNAAVAIGRYAEDSYQGGHPWYLTTLAAAEQLYDAIDQWERQGFITVTNLSLAFFRDLYPKTAPGLYLSSSPTYAVIISLLKDYADGFIGVVQKFTLANGSLSEQFSRDTGDPLSARDLTWSFAAFRTAAARRGACILDVKSVDSR